MKYCKACGHDSFVKNGRTQKGIQRYKCKSCFGTFREGDKRLKHPIEKRIKVIKMYLEGVGIRSIERLEGVSNPLIIYWIRHFSDLVHKEIGRTNIPDYVRNIEKNFTINILCTNAYPVYAQYNIANQHVITKAEMSLVEPKNSLIRHYLARFNRKTKRYSKAIDMIENSLILLFNKDILESIFI